jgi:chromosome segregation ATPase
MPEPGVHSTDQASEQTKHETGQEQQTAPPSSEEKEEKSQKETFDAEYVAALRREAARYRTERKELEEKLKKLEEAQLSETERIANRLAELEKQQAEWMRERQELLVRSAVVSEAVGLNIIDPEAAFKLLDLASLQFDEDGRPVNIKDALTKLIKEKPYLVGSRATTNTTTANLQRGSGTMSREAREQQLRAILQGGMQGKVWDFDRIQPAPEK